VVSPPIRRGEVLVDANGAIAAVAPVGVLDVPIDIELIDLGDAILLPGLVNVHAHPELAMFRGALEDLPFRDWILRLVGAKRGVLLEEDSHAAALWTMVESIAGGVTTLAATETSGAAAGAMTAAGLRGIVYQEVFGPDPSQVDESMEKLTIDLERTTAAAGSRVAVGISPHAPYTVSNSLYRAAARFALREGLPMAVHIAESQAERALVVSGEGDFAPGLRARGIAATSRGRSPIEMLSRLGVLDARPLLIHCVDVDDQDIATIAEAGCAVAHCPVANAKLGHGLAPVPRLREAGLRVGLGTDSVGSNNRLDLLEEARIAALLQRAAAKRFDLLPATELLRMCTIEGATALGLEDRVGTLEPGKQADLCAVAVGRPHSIPNLDPVDTLFHAARGSDVVMTVVAGDVLYASGEFRTIDVGAARAAVEAAGDRLRGTL
jgi:cytosine/adenosine deaminase-related metal-dependent hydrolase